MLSPEFGKIALYTSAQPGPTVPAMGNHFAFFGLSHEVDRGLRDDDEVRVSEDIRPPEDRSVNSEIKRSPDNTNLVSKSEPPTCHIYIKALT